MAQLTQRDMVLFLRSQTAAGTWHGSRHLTTIQSITSLALRALVIGWDEPKIAELVDTWSSRHNVHEDIASLLPAAIEVALQYADDYITKWTAENQAREERRSALRAARPRNIIRELLATQPDLVITPGVVSALGIAPATSRQTLKRMTEAGELTRLSHGRYGLAAMDAPVEQPAETKDVLIARESKLMEELSDIRRHNAEVAACQAPRPRIYRQWRWLPAEVKASLAASHGQPWEPLRPPTGMHFKSTTRVIDELAAVAHELYLSDAA